MLLNDKEKEMGKRNNENGPAALAQCIAYEVEREEQELLLEKQRKAKWQRSLVTSGVVISNCCTRAHAHAISVNTSRRATLDA